MTLKDKVVLITGASRGVGEALAYGFAAEGAIVVATARTLAPNTGEWQGSLEETVERIKASGGRAHAIACDVTQEAAVKSTVERVNSEIGAVDVLINNAGLSVRGSIVDMSVGDFDRVMTVNVRGPFLMCKYIVPTMIVRRQGNIINISFQAGHLDRKEPHRIRDVQGGAGPVQPEHGRGPEALQHSGKRDEPGAGDFLHDPQLGPGEQPSGAGYRACRGGCALDAMAGAAGRFVYRQGVAAERLRQDLAIGFLL